MENQQDKLSTLLAVVSFLIPIVGLILYFVKKEKEPLAAKSALKLAAIGFVVGIALNVLASLLR